MTDHSPTPWYVLDEHRPGIESADDRSIVVYGADEPGDEAGVHGQTPDQARANAAFIVKAVNNHDALVNALRRIEQFNGGQIRSPMQDIAKDALAVVSAPQETDND